MTKMAEGGFSSKEAARITKLMDLDLDKEGISMEEWTMGLNEELEHKDVTQEAAVMTGKITYDHLKEDPKYYSKLKKIDKGLIDSFQPAIMNEDNISMLILQTDTLSKSFQPQDLKPGSEETTKGDLVDTDDGDEKDAELDAKAKTMKKSVKEILQDAQKSITACKEDMLEKKCEKAEKPDEDEETIDKALTAIAVSSLSRRQRLDAAYKLGMVRGRANPRITGEPAQLTNLNIGSNHSRPAYEPPVVPVRKVEQPQPLARQAAIHKSCQQHGYVHKSDMKCPMCERAEVREAKPLWRR